MANNWIDEILEEVNEREQMYNDDPLVIEGYYIGGNIVIDPDQIPTNEDIWC